ncbi:MAG: dGTP triphosphohydrolase [Coraliomargaritaceae bacterium]
MQNSFYNEFDQERFPDTQSPEGEYRNAFQIERDRIIFAYPFRKLQSKTQVFQSGEYDFYRTRLTHSIEVAKIGRSICHFLQTSSPHLRDDFFIDPDLTEAICLAHDLGHPPFGHIGERKLNQMMAAEGGFEGNAQTLRILTELLYERPGRTKGIAPTRALLDGVLKYKALQKEWHEEKGEFPGNHFIYDEQVDLRTSVIGDISGSAELNTPAALNQLKSIECQIMDWADDTAYSLHDIVDGIHARYINVGSLNEWAQNQGLTAEEKNYLDKLCDVIRSGSYEPYFGSRIGKFVHGCQLQRREGFLSEQTQRHAFDLSIDPDVQAESALYKRIALDLIFRSTQIQQIEFKGGHLLEKLFHALAEHCTGNGKNRLQILPESVRQLIDAEEDTRSQMRRLCDYIAGLTDGQAVRIYKRLFDPGFGSISELV